MRARFDPPPEALALAAAQGEVLSVHQAQAFGLGRRPLERLVAQGHWSRLAVGVYCTRPEVPGWNTLAWAGVLLGGDRARLGGRAAAHLHGLCEPPELIEVLIPFVTRRCDREPWQFVREREGVRLRVRGEPPRTGIEDTVIDLCAGATEREVMDLLTRAVQSRRTTAARLRQRIDERPEAHSRRMLREVLGDVAHGAQSPLELVYLRSVERAHGLPRGRRQARLGPYLRDVRYDDYATVVELDGRIGHEGTGRFRDMHRDNRSALAGEVTLRFGWHDVRGDPCQVARVVAGVLSQRGWPGPPGRCGRCRRMPLEKWNLVS